MGTGTGTVPERGIDSGGGGGMAARGMLGRHGLRGC